MLAHAFGVAYPSRSRPSAVSWRNELLHCSLPRRPHPTGKMKLQPGMAALVTGGAAGIGKALSLALAEKGLFVTIVDYSEKNGKEVSSLIVNKRSKYAGLEAPAATFIMCDVSNASDLAAAFDKHMHTYGRLDICINSAAIATPQFFNKDTSDGTNTWRPALNINLVAVIDCTRLAMQIMRFSKMPGVIINMGSAAGLYPSADPIYSASKGGVVLFTRSLAPLKRDGIRVNVICPEFIQTDMGSKAGSKMVEAAGGFIPMEQILKGAFELIEDETKAGDCLWITNRRGLEYWPTPEEKQKYHFKTYGSNRKFTKIGISSGDLPKYFEKIVVHMLSNNFRNATRIVKVPLKLPIESQQVLVKVIYAGVNASDVNFSSGSYFNGGAKQAAGLLPFDVGFEAVGIVAAVGDLVTHVEIGTPVALMSFGSYAEYVKVPARHLLSVPRPDPEAVAMLTSGLTASISLETAGQMRSGQTVLVTAAAGGTGQFAVQLAKFAGNKVIATCGGEKKAILLKSLGADRIIDYRKESVKDVLKREFPKGVDIVYESVGGAMFSTCLNALAIHGRLVVIGMISQYQGEDGWKPQNYTGLCEKILAKSQTVAGFFLPQHAHKWQQHMENLFNLHAFGKLKVAVDPEKFSGVQSVPDAVEYLHSGESLGKVVVCIDPSYAPAPSKL